MITLTINGKEVSVEVIGGFRVDVEVNPEEISLCYHNCDEINRTKNQIQNKRFYFKGKNELFIFDNISIEKDLLCVQYSDKTSQNISIILVHILQITGITITHLIRSHLQYFLRTT